LQSFKSKERNKHWSLTQLEILWHKQNEFEENMDFFEIIVDNLQIRCSKSSFFFGAFILDTPPNSSKDPKVGLRAKHRKKNKVTARSLTCNTLGVGGVLNSGMGIGWTHKRKFKMISTWTTKKRGWLVQIEWKWCT